MHSSTRELCLLFCLFVHTIAMAQVSIGTETNQNQKVPFEPYYSYTWAQSIYYASEINDSGNIATLSYYFSGTTTLPNSQDITIYMGHTSKTTFASDTDWVGVSDLTIVYTGGIDVSSGVGWTTFNLDTPFSYNGTDNLVIAFDENQGGYDSFNDDFHCSSVSVPRSICYRSDSTNPNPASPPTSTFSPASYVPNIRMDIVNCTPPQATARVNEDCANGFTVDVEVTNLGGAGTLNIMEGANIIQSSINMGTYTLGPFTNGTPVDIRLESDSDPSCYRSLGTFVNATVCPIAATITCGQAPLAQSYCYEDNDPTTWTYTASNSSATLTVSFSQGYLESCCDDLIIYDGVDNTAPQLYNSNSTTSLTGVTVSSTGASLFMDINSDGSVSCSGGSGVQWEFEVECIGGCDFPVGTASYDCGTNEITLDISNAGLPIGSYSATIDGVGASQTVSTTGTYPTFGPFTPDQSYNIVLEGEMGCRTTIPYIFGACNLPRTPSSSCVSLWSNSDFELGSNGWTGTSKDSGGASVAVANTMFNATLPLAGTNSAYLGGHGGTDPPSSLGPPFTTRISRNFLGQVGKTYQLYYWYILDACDSNNDTFQVLVDGNQEFVITGADAICGDQKWREMSLDLSSYADGNIHTVEFVLIENETNNSASRAFIDELLLEQCEPFCGNYSFLGGAPQSGSAQEVAPGMFDYETDGPINSIQTIQAGTTVDYDSATEITLAPTGTTFEVKLGATFCAFIDGCNGSGGAVNPLNEEEQPQRLKGSEDKISKEKKKEK